MLTPLGFYQNTCLSYYQMPIEIHELIIKVTLHDGATGPAPKAAPAAARPGDRALQQLQYDVTQDCLRQVLAELQRRRER